MDYLGDVVTSQTLLLLNELRVAKTRSRKTLLTGLELKNENVAVIDKFADDTNSW
jgi:hypothetical protein